MSEPRPEPATVPQALGRLRVALEDAYARASRELRLSPQQAELLCAAMRPAAIGDLARELRCDRSNISRLVDRAARRRLVHRRGDELDGRVTVIELTPAGQRIAQRFVEALEAQVQPVLADWPNERQKMTVDTLNTLADALDKARASERPLRPRAPHSSQRRKTDWRR